MEYIGGREKMVEELNWEKQGGETSDLVPI